MSKNLFFLISLALLFNIASNAVAQTPDDLDLWAEYLFDSPDPSADTSGNGFHITELGEGATAGVLEGLSGTAYHGNIGDFNESLCAYEHTPYAILPPDAWPGDAVNGDITIEMVLYFDEEWETTDFCGGEKEWAWYAQRNLTAGGEQWGFMQEGGVLDVNGVFTISDNLWWDGRNDMIGYISEGLSLVKETWYHWVVSIDNTNHTIYHWIDGVPVITEMPDHSKTPSEFSGPVDSLWLGATLYDDPDGWHPFRGRIDEVRFYKGYTETYFPPSVPTTPMPQATRPSPTNDAINVSIPVTLSWAQGIFVGDVNGHEVYFGTSFADVNDANKNTPGVFRGPDDVYSYLIDPCDPNTIKHAYDVPDTLDLGRTYFWRIDEVNEAYVPGPNEPNAPPDGRWKGSVWNFTIEGQAYNPLPADSAINVPKDVVLSWTPGFDADTHDVYFGIDEASVEDANHSSAEYIDNRDVNSYDPEGLDLDKTYYWRIDEVNYITIKGNIWSFTTAGYLAVDDFDSYENDAALQAVWMDYWTNDTGAEVFLEQITVHNGNAMRCDYDNLSKLIGVYGSMTDADIASLPIGPNWSGAGGKAIQLYFYGDVGNSATVNDKMYVALEDASANVGLSYYPDVNDINVPVWQQWNIDLQDFNSQLVDLTNIAKVSIGFGTYGGSKDNQGGTGVVFFDEFSVWRTRCVQEFALGDVTGDCIINSYDLQAMAENWLISDYIVEPEAPNSDSLLVEYLFESTYNDTSGNGLDGEESISGTGVSSGALSLDGVGYVDIPFGGTVANPFGGTQDFSISMWFKTSDKGLLISSSEPNDTSACEMSMNVYTAQVQNPGEVLYDNINVGWMGAGALLNNDQWHHIATTYDVATLQHHIYVDGMLETWADLDGVWDPNITDIATHTVRIGWTYCDDSLLSTNQFSGYIDDVRIYDSPLSHSNVLYLAGIVEDTYFPLHSQANLFPKAGSYGWDPNDRDIIDFRDYSITADNWLEGPTLWP